jgi:hypothetical protein
MSFPVCGERPVISYNPRTIEENAHNAEIVARYENGYLKLTYGTIAYSLRGASILAGLKGHVTVSSDFAGGDVFASSRDAIGYPYIGTLLAADVQPAGRDQILVTFRAPQCNQGQYKPMKLLIPRVVLQAVADLEAVHTDEVLPLRDRFLDAFERGEPEAVINILENEAPNVLVGVQSMALADYAEKLIGHYDSLHEPAVRLMIGVLSEELDRKLASIGDGTLDRTAYWKGANESILNLAGRILDAAGRSTSGNRAELAELIVRLKTLVENLRTKGVKDKRLEDSIVEAQSLLEQVAGMNGTDRYGTTVIE